MELFAVILEVFEARDLLRLDTPLEKNKKTLVYLGRKMSLTGSSRIKVTEEGASGNGEEPSGSAAEVAVEANEGEEGKFDDTNLRYEFCARVLIATQIAEGK